MYRTLALALAAAACGGAPAETARRPAPPATQPTASQPADPFRDKLNLDFEDGDPPTGWMFRGDGFTLAVDATQHHAGARSVRITHAGGKGFAVVMRTVPIEAAAGKQIVITGWMKRVGAEGHATVWVRADHGEQPVAFDSTQYRTTVGSDWTALRVEIGVPREATLVAFGVVSSVQGEAWADDLQLSFGEYKPFSAHGVVVDDAKRPVAGAFVAAIGLAGSASGTARTDASGRFAIELPRAGYGFTATTKTGYGYVASAELTGDITIALKRGVPVRVRITGAAKNAIVEATRRNGANDDVWDAPLGDDGVATFELPAGEYRNVATGQAFAEAKDAISVEDGKPTVVDLTVAQPPSEPVVEWV
jgi:hypothetical protein